MRQSARTVWGRWLWLSAAVAASVAVVIAVEAVRARSTATATATATVKATASAKPSDVQPFPGTPDVSPQSDIGFPALAPRQITALAVVGSRSGPHRGRLVALPPGHGTAFLPLRPFTAGERVSVRASLSSPAAGTASGAPGATRIRFAFKVAAPPSAWARAARRARLRRRRAARMATARGRARAARARRQRLNVDTQHFHSERWLHPPLIRVAGRDPDPGEGDIFADAQDNVESGPLILNPNGGLVYFRPLLHTGAFNVEVQQYQGQSVLTYWQGVGIDPGHGVIVNHQYQQIATVYAGNGYGADAHEFQITPQGDALITVYAPVRADLSSVGGPRDGILMDSIVQEINIATGKVVWEWHASGHVPLDQTHAGRVGPWPYDFFHINSIQQLANGNLLVSGRNTWALYEISKRTGRTLMTIGGSGSSFAMGPGTNFEWQHDARMQPDGTITVFDNGSEGNGGEPHSRGLRLRLDYRHRRVTLVRAFTSHPPQLAVSQGSVQPLPDGNTFVGWGAAPYLTEFGAGGRQRFSLHFPRPVESYRGYRFQWWGQPTMPPSVAAAASGQGTTIYASWDGATDVAGWQVLAGPRPAALMPVAEHPNTTFETTISVPTTQPYIGVQALGGDGQVLGTSAVVAR